MKATTPIEIQGRTYEHYTLSLSVTGTYTADGAMTGSVAMRLVPVRITEDGGVENAPEGSHSFAVADLGHADQETKAAVETIREAVQTWVNQKGL